MFRLVLIFSLFSFISVAQPMNVLFVGNSFTHMNSMYRIFQNLANSKGKIITADTLATSGSNLLGHCNRECTYDKVKARDWDVVFIQGYSRELSHDSLRIAKETIPYAQQLIDSIKKYNPCINIYYYMTWGYEEGWLDSIPEDTYEMMQQRIQRGYLQLSRATGGYPIAPVGMVWQEIRKRYPDIGLYESDKAHPTNYGSFVAACTFYSTLFKESSIDGKAPKRVDLLDAKNIQQTAADYVLKNYSFYNLDTNQHIWTGKKPKIDFQLKEKWLSVTTVNKTSGATKYYWDFGDGKTSTKKNPKHYYKQDGKYTVTLYVKANCNWYKSKKTVRVSSKIKEANKPQNKTTPVKP